MIGNSLDHFCFAGAANPVGTGEGNVDAVVEKDVQDGFPGRHGDGPAAAMQAHGLYTREPSLSALLPC